MAALVRQLQRNIFAVSHNVVIRNGKTAIPPIISQTRRLLSEDKMTHTGQQFKDDDFRRARFIDKQKEVNPNFSEKLISEVPPIEVDDRVVSCDGGGGALGHPKVYINLDQGVPNSCGYCGLRFVQKAH